MICEASKLLGGFTGALSGDSDSWAARWLGRVYLALYQCPAWVYSVHSPRVVIGVHHATYGVLQTCRSHLWAVELVQLCCLLVVDCGLAFLGTGFDFEQPSWEGGAWVAGQKLFM